MRDKEMREMCITSWMCCYYNMYHFVEILYDDSIVNNKTNCLPSRC